MFEQHRFLIALNEETVAEARERVARIYCQEVANACIFQAGMMSTIFQAGMMSTRRKRMKGTGFRAFLPVNYSGAMFQSERPDRNGKETRPIPFPLDGYIKGRGGLSEAEAKA